MNHILQATPLISCEPRNAGATCQVLCQVSTWTAPGDTLQGVTPEGKKIVRKFTKNCGDTRSDRLKKVRVTPE